MPNGHIEFRDGQAYEVRTKATKEGRKWKHEEVLTPIEDLIPYLQHQLVLKQGTRFEHVWKYVVRSADMLEKVFSGALGRHPLAPYVADSNREPSEDDDDEKNGMRFLELHWHATCREFKGDASFNLYPSFHGVGPHTYVNGDGVEETIQDSGWSVSMTPVCDLMSYELKINNRVKVYARKGKSINVEIAAEGDRPFTVYDALDAIFEEISFYGSPDDKVRECAEIDQRVAEAKEDCDRMARGEEPKSLRSIDELRQELEKQRDEEE